MSLDEELLYDVWLNCSLMGDARRIAKCIKEFGTAREFHISGAFSQENLEILNMKVFVESEILFKKAYNVVQYCKSNGIRILTMQDREYPEKLKTIAYPPFILYVKGALLNLTDSVTIAIVGSRDASEYGKKQAKKITRDLSRCGFIVVSGLARGIDTIAHRASLDNGGKTISVLPCGIDEIYPRQNKELAKLIETNGTLVTELPPGTRVSPIVFAARNRIIASLSDGIFVVEAKLKSGTCYTVNHGIENGVDIFALIGNVDEPNSEYPNKLAAEGANIVRNALDIISYYAMIFPERLVKNMDSFEELKLSEVSCEKESPESREHVLTPDPGKNTLTYNKFVRNEKMYEKLDQLEKTVIQYLLKNDVSHADEISRECNISIAKISVIMFHLQLKGIIHQNVGNTYTLNEAWNGEEP